MMEKNKHDNPIRMLFAFCYPSLPYQLQAAMVLKSLCGFGIEEIADVFLTDNETINKRIRRAEEKITNEHIKLEIPSDNSLTFRLDAVLNVLNLLFNSSSRIDLSVRKHLCSETMRLCTLLAEKKSTAQPKTFALLSLMCFHAARPGSGTDELGRILLLREQNRKTWNRPLILKGINYMEKSAWGDELNEYHVESGIEFYHCTASGFEKTDWAQLLTLYDMLLKVKDTIIVRLNRAMVVSQLFGYEKAITEVKSLKNTGSNFLYHATLGELYFQANKYSVAMKCFEKGMGLTSLNTEKVLFRRKILLCRASESN